MPSSNVRDVLRDGKAERAMIIRDERLLRESGDFPASTPRGIFKIECMYKNEEGAVYLGYEMRGLHANCYTGPGLCQHAAVRHCWYMSRSCT